MELLLIPILLLAGVTLIPVGVNGVPSFAGMTSQTHGSLSGSRLDRTVELPRRASTTDRRPAKVASADRLLTDLMEEMIQLRSELEVMRQEVGAIAATRETTEEAAPRRRRKPAA